MYNTDVCHADQSAISKGKGQVTFLIIANPSISGDSELLAKGYLGLAGP